MSTKVNFKITKEDKEELKKFVGIDKKVTDEVLIKEVLKKQKEMSESISVLSKIKHDIINYVMPDFKEPQVYKDAHSFINAFKTFLTYNKKTLN